MSAPETPARTLRTRLAARLRAEFASRLARDSLLVFVFNSLCRALGLGKEILVAALFGVGGQLDAYVMALLVPTFLAHLLGGSFSSALIPALGELAARGAGDGKKALAGLLGRALAVQALLLLATGAALLLLPPQALLALAPGAGPERLAEIKGMQDALLPMYVLTCLANVLAALVNYRGDFRGPARAATLGSAAAILAIALLHGALGIGAVIAAVNIGVAVEFLLLARLAWRSWGNVFRGWEAGACAALSPLLRDWAMLAFGATLAGLSAFVDNAIASTLGEGAISALSYAGKLPGGFVTLLGLTLSTVLLPYFTGVVHNAPAGQLLVSSRRIMRRLLLLTVPLAVAGALASPLLVELLYQRGRFDAQAAGLVSALQLWYFVKIPFLLLNIAAARMLQALSRFRFLLGLQAVLLLLNVLASLGLSRLFGVQGIAAASALVALLSAVASLAVIHGHGRGHGRQAARPQG